MWGTYIIGYLFTNLNQDFVQNNYTIVFLAFSTTSSILKKICKTIAKHIDKFRIENSKNSNYYHNGISSISTEYYMEFYFSMYYYLSAKFWVSTNIPDTYTDLIQVLLISMLQEIWETNFLFSKLHFRIQCQFMPQLFATHNMRKSMTSFDNNNNNNNNNSSIGQNGNDKCCCCCKNNVCSCINIKFVLCKLMCHECSNINVWRERCCMDIILRFTCEIVSTVYYILLFVTLGPKFTKHHLYHIYVSTAYEYGLIYTLIYCSVDVVHFVLTVIVNYCYYKYDMFEPFFKFVNQIKQSKWKLFWNIIIINATVVSLQFLYY